MHSVHHGAGTLCDGASAFGLQLYLAAMQPKLGRNVATNRLLVGRPPSQEEIADVLKEEMELWHPGLFCCEVESCALISDVFLAATRSY